MNQQQEDALIEQLEEDKDKLQLEISLSEVKLKEQKEHLKTILYVLENFEK